MRSDVNDVNYDYYEKQINHLKSDNDLQANEIKKLTTALDSAEWLAEENRKMYRTEIYNHSNTNGWLRVVTVLFVVMTVLSGILLKQNDDQRKDIETLTDNEIARGYAKDMSEKYMQQADSIAESRFLTEESVVSIMSKIPNKK